MAEQREPFLRIVWTDPVTRRRGYVVIDRLVNGIAGGGTRMRAGVTLDEVERLARTMSLKNGAVEVPGGGAKGGLDCDPRDAEARPMLTRFVRAMRPILETYWGTAEDMGTTQELLDEVFVEVGMRGSVEASLNRTDGEAAFRRLAEGLAIRVRGIGLGDVVGGYGVAQAAAAACQYRGWDIAAMRAAVQGFGAMGGSTARYLAELGARVVGIADVHGTVTNPEGLDVERLLASRRAHGEIDRTALRPGDRELPPDGWLDVETDILAPAAVADAITAGNAGRVTVRLVVEAANIPTTVEAQQELHRRGVVVVPDFVANGGTNAWYWWLLLGHVEPTAEAAFAKISETIGRTVRDLLERADREGTTPREAAEVVAERNLDDLVRRYGTDVPLADG